MFPVSCVNGAVGHELKSSHTKVSCQTYRSKVIKFISIYSRMSSLRNKIEIINVKTEAQKQTCVFTCVPVTEVS